MPVLVVERAGAVATITLNRPDRGNALTTALKSELLAALTQVGDDEGVRAVVLTGAGSVFCAGQDLAEHAAALSRDPVSAFATIEQHYAPIVTTLTTMPKPVLASINGTCVGAGLGLALACDLRVAAASARLATAFAAIGLTCDSGLSATLVRAVGAARASELILLGEPFTAAQAVEWGIVTRVVDAAELATVAAELAARLAAGPTLAYAESKLAIAAAVGPPLGGVLGQSRDHADAVEAFLAKRTPEFHGRGTTIAATTPHGRSAAHEMFAADAASRALGIELLAADSGTATLRMRVTEAMVNGHHIAHGGFVFLLADCACNSHGPTTVAAAADITFVAPASLDDELIAEATERTRFGRSGIYDVTVFRADGGKRTIVAEFRGHSRTVRTDSTP